MRIAKGENCSEILKEAYAFAVEENLSWPQNVNSIVSQIGLRQSFIDIDIDLHLQSFQRLSDIFHQQAFEDMKRVDSKLRTYCKLKLEPGFEKYLDEIPVKERTALTKLRLSNHLLMIEKGRGTWESMIRISVFAHFVQISLKTKSIFSLDALSIDTLGKYSWSKRKPLSHKYTTGATTKNS